MKQSQFYYLLRRGLFSAGSAIIKNGLVMFNKFTTAGISHPAQGSAEFNGTSDYIITPTPAFTGTDSFTYCAWIYTEDTTANRGILMSEENTGWGLQGLTIGPSANIYFYAGTGTSSTSLRGSASGTLPTNTWVFVSATHTQSRNTLYINGSIASQGGTTTLVTTAGVDYRIGKYSSSTWNGNLANVAIWNRALSSDEINSVMWKSYEALSGTESNGLQAWYSLDDITSPAASLATMQQLATDKNATIENTAAITAAINSLS